MTDPARDPLPGHLRRYHSWLDAAERHVADWFTSAEGREPEDGVDHRVLSSVVMTLRRVIEGRRILFCWEKNEHKPNDGRPAEITDGEFLALMEECSAGSEDSMDEV